MTPFSPDLLTKIIDQACAIQQIPAPTFMEQERANYLRRKFKEVGLQVETDETGNVYGRYPGGSAAPIVISAHLDTVHPLSCDLKLERSADRISGPGIGDNSVSLAVLICLAEHYHLHGTQFSGDLWFVANTAEEGLGNLAGMRSVVDRFGDRPKAYIALEGMGLGLIYHRGLGVSRYRIHVKTAGGHSWGNHGMPSAIHEIALLVARLSKIPLSKRPRTTLNVGKIEGGTSINTIANHAWIEVDLRSEDFWMLQKLVGRVQQRVKASEIPGVEVTMEGIGDRPAGDIRSGHPLVVAAQTCLVGLGIQPQLEIGSTDANVPLSRGYPAICIGLTRGGCAHTSNEFILTEPLTIGVRQVLCLIDKVWEGDESGA